MRKARIARPVPMVSRYLSKQVLSGPVLSLDGKFYQIRLLARFAITSIGGVNSILMLVVAILLGGVAALLADNWLVSRTQVATTTTTSVIAARQLPFGTPLTEDSIQEIPWPARAIPAGLFTSKEALFKDGRRIALATIQESEPILTAEITGPGESASLSTLLDKDKRAITIRVDDVRVLQVLFFQTTVLTLS
jgi:SAF domain